MAGVRIENVDKSFGPIKVIRNVHIEAEDGEFVVLVGPSGCGKSTLLRMIAGLEEITSGQIRIGDRVVNNLNPKDRDIAMVFQNYALYPHMTVRENMEFSLVLRKIGRRNGTRASIAPPRSLVSGSFSIGVRANCPAASDSGSRWAARSCATRKFSFSTSRCRTSTPN